MSGCHYIRDYLSESGGDTYFGDFPEIEVIQKAQCQDTTSPFSCIPLDLDYRCPPTFDHANVRHTFSQAVNSAHTMTALFVLAP